MIISLLAHFDHGLSVFMTPGPWPSEWRRYGDEGDNEQPVFEKKKLAEGGGLEGPQRSAERRGGKNGLFSAALSLTCLCLSWKTKVNRAGTSTPCGKQRGGEGSFWPLSGSLWWLLLCPLSLSFSLALFSDVCRSSLFVFRSGAGFPSSSKPLRTPLMLQIC